MATDGPSLADKDIAPAEEPSPAAVRSRIRIPLQIALQEFADSEVITFTGLEDGREHLVVILGNALRQRTPLVRLHSECLTGDVLKSARCDCGAQLREAISVIHAQGGVLLYLRQEGRGIGLYNKLDAYALQDMGMDTYEANRALSFKDDQRTYDVAAQMLFTLGVTNIELLSNNPEKARQLRRAGITVQRQRPTGAYVTYANRRYLEAKVDYASHAINMDVKGGAR